MQQITRYQIERCQPDILIQISGDTYDMLEFHHAASIVKTGAEVARKNINAIKWILSYLLSCPKDLNKYDRIH